MGRLHGSARVGRGGRLELLEGRRQAAHGPAQIERADRWFQRTARAPSCRTAHPAGESVRVLAGGRRQDAARALHGAVAGSGPPWVSGCLLGHRSRRLDQRAQILRVRDYAIRPIAVVGVAYALIHRWRHSRPRSGRGLKQEAVPDRSRNRLPTRQAVAHGPPAGPTELLPSPRRRTQLCCRGCWGGTTHSSTRAAQVLRGPPSTARRPGWDRHALRAPAGASGWTRAGRVTPARGSGGDRRLCPAGGDRAAPRWTALDRRGPRHRRRGDGARGRSAGRAGRTLEEARPRDGLALGLAQAIALIPGVSRSGATLTAARARGFARADAQTLFLACRLPVLLGVGALEGARLARSGARRARVACWPLGPYRPSPRLSRAPARCGAGRPSFPGRSTAVRWR